jgi:TonB family protein
MAFTLLGSRLQANKGKRLRMGAVVLAAHVVVIALVMQATARAASAVGTVRVDTAMVFLARAPRHVAEPLAASLPVKGFQTITVPRFVPSSIPPVNLSVRFDPRDYSGIGVEGGRGTGVVGGALPRSVLTLARTYSEASVDEPPELLPGVPPPPYPTEMHLAGIEGQVVLQAVVDTVGRIEPNSILIVKSSNLGFDTTVREWALEARFRPGRLQGRPVRVRINLPINFSTGD